MLTIFVLLQLKSPVSAIPGFTSSGTEFSLVPPKCFNSQSFHTEMHFLTQAMTATVDIFLPNTAGRTKQTSKKQLHLTRYQISYLTLRNDKHYVSENGIYNSIKIISTSSVRIAMLLECNNTSSEIHSSLVEILPKESSHRLYYLTTWHGHPCVMVSSFGHKTMVTVKFPKYTPHFSERCEADKNCESGKEVTVRLKEYETWFFELSGERMDLQNTVIKADFPVFVINGNRKCKTMQGANDICFTHAKPKAAWGREYVVPTFRLKTKWKPKSYRYLRFNMDNNYPFHYSLFYYNKSSITSNNTLERGVADGLDYTKTLHTLEPFIVSAEKPFALNYYYGTSVVSVVTGFELQNLIPVEQWMNGNINGEHYSSVSLGYGGTVVISTAGHGHVTGFPNNVGRMELKSNNRSYVIYSVGKESRAVMKRIYTRKPGKKVMVYKMRCVVKATCAVRALDFYQGTINTPICTRQVPVVSDGVDNDCDGRIDEELFNGMDDDGDGEVDEDYSLPHGPSEWTEWKEACDLRCKGKNVTVKVRSCEMSYFEGCGEKNETISCRPEPVCPAHCQGVCKPVSDGCVAFDKRTGKCSHCKEGYVHEEYCIVKCPFGWTGQDCTRGPRLLSQMPDLKVILSEWNRNTTMAINDSNPQISEIWLVPTVAFAVMFVLTGVCIVFRQEKQARVLRSHAIQARDSQCRPEDSLTVTQFEGDKQPSEMIKTKPVTRRVSEMSNRSWTSEVGEVEMDGDTVATEISEEIKEEQMPTAQ